MVQAYHRRLLTCSQAGVVLEGHTVVLGLVEKVVTGDRCQLVEALAERIAAAIAEECGPLELVVRVRKPNPPVATQFDGVEVEIRRAYA